MAKKTKQNAPVQNTNPYENRNSAGKRLGNLMGCACLLVFALSEELWIGMLACAIGFAVIYGIQVFHDKTEKWYTSPYLYCTLVTLGLTYAEYTYQLLTNLMTFGK